MVLTRDAILAVDDLPREEMHIPEWGGSVFVRAMTGAERDTYEMGLYLAHKNGATSDTVRSQIATRCMVDEQGNRLFSDKDAAALARKSGAVLERVRQVAARLSGMDEGAVEAETENFGDAPAAHSRSD